MNDLFHCFLILLLATLSMLSCSSYETNAYLEMNTIRNDAFHNIIIHTPEVSFLAGEPDYDIEFLVITPNNDEAKQVNIYATFILPEENSPTSNEVLFATYPIDQKFNTTLIKDQITYEQLRNGILLDGNPLTVNQTEIPYGSNWNLRLSLVDGFGNEVFSGNQINVKVLSPYSGLYTVKESYLYRYDPIFNPNQLTEWDGETRYIGFKGGTTYFHPDYFGPFAAEGQFEFVINEDHSIIIPDAPEQNNWFAGTYS